MRVIHLSTFDSGGAGAAAYLFHRSLCSAGVTSDFFVRTKHSRRPDITATKSFSPWFRLRDHLARRAFEWHNGDPAARYWFYDRGNAYPPTIRALKADVGKVDAIILHSITAYVAPEYVLDMQRSVGAKVFWYLMDAAPMSGGCHFAWDCGGISRGCGGCPALRSTTERDYSRRNWERKRQAVAKMDLTILAPTTEMLRLAKSSRMFHDKPAHLLMLAVDETVFRVARQSDARRRLDLPEDRPVIFFGADAINNERKGLHYLVDAVRIIAGSPLAVRRPMLVTAGRGNPTFGELPFEHRHLGFLQGDEMLATAYQAADVFVSPSVEDAGPFMVNQSVMCGTPVVAFPVGVAPDLVVTGTSGYLVGEITSPALARSIEWVLSLPKDGIERLRSATFEYARERLSALAQADHFARILSHDETELR